MGFGPSPDTWRVRSDADDQYTSALAQNVMDLESFGDVGSGSNRPPLGNCIIDRATIWSVENLDWDLMFFRTAASQPSADPDLDTMIGWISFVVADGVQIAGAGLFRYYRSDLNIRYQSEETTPQVHVGLINRNAGAKTAGGGGELVVELAGPVF